MYKSDKNANFGAGVDAGAKVPARRTLKTHFKVEAFRPDPVTGELVPLWVQEFDNLVVNAGLDDSLDKHLKGSSYTAAWYVGLTDGTPTPAAGDTMGSHGGWAEVEDYDEATRQTLTLGSVSGQSVSNTASKAAFTIDSNNTTIGGAFITTVNTKGGSTGILYGVGAFTAGDKTLDDDDTLNVTATFTAAAA